MLVQTACEALRSGHVLELHYDGFVRLIEVHAVGFTADDNPMLRGWQIGGGPGGNEPVGWVLLRLDEIRDASITHQQSFAPRPGYKPGDTAMTVMTCQL